MFSPLLIMVDERVNVHHLPTVLHQVATRCSAPGAWITSRGPHPQQSLQSRPDAFQERMALDATGSQTPNAVTELLLPDIQAPTDHRVLERWSEYGLPDLP